MVGGVVKVVYGVSVVVRNRVGEVRVGIILILVGVGWVKE